MTNFLEHIFRKKAGRAENDDSLVNLDHKEKEIPKIPELHLERKIHHDLDSLIEDSSHVNAKVVYSASSRCASPDDAKGSLPLRPNVRRQSSQKRSLQPLAAPSKAPTTIITQLPISRETTRRPTTRADVSFSASTLSSDSMNTSSVGTFGTRPPWRIREHIGDAHQTPTSERSEGGSTRILRSLSAHSRTATHSHESMSKRSRRSSMSSASRDTFGKASPSRSPTNVRRPRQLSDAAPPLPPLVHPAFSATSNSTLRNSFPADDRPPLTRNAHSTPMLQKRASSGGNTPKTQTRTRTRTSSSGRSTSLAAAARILAFDLPKKNAPTTGRRRSQSSASSRRASPESRRDFQASTPDAKEGGDSWEAAVSKAIVRLSLESCHGRDYQEASTSRKGKARGDRAQRTRSLGSPFFLSNTHSYQPGITLSDNLTARYNLPTNIKTGEAKNSSPMSQHQPGPSQSSRSAKSSSKSRTPSPPKQTTSAPRRTSPLASTSHLVPPSVSITGPTPDSSPIFPEVSQQPPDAESPSRSQDTNGLTPTTPPPLRTPSSSMSKGKRKAEEVEGGTPPKDGKEPHTTFAADTRPHRPSGGSSYAPSSFHHLKRTRLAVAPESQPGSRPASAASANAKTTGSWSSKTSNHPPPPRSVTPGQQPQRAPSRRSLRSMSQASIPISALISPHAPSITPSGVFHMRDPRKPGPVLSTPWTLSLPSGPAEPNEGWRGWVERGGSPLHAWLFFVGFVLFPLWWIASFLSVPKTRQLGGGETEKGVVLDDPQLEYDSYSWRRRCRILAVVSLFTYIPFIVLVAIFASR